MLKHDLRSIDELRKIKARVIPTLGWLNHSFPRLLDPEYWPSLTYDHPFDEYDRIGITVPSKVTEGTLSEHSSLLKWGMPRDIAGELRQRSGQELEVKLLNDAHAWLAGAICHSDLAGQRVDYPCALIALGTGIAFAYAERADRFKLVEFVEERIDWTPLRKVADTTAEVYEILGIHFFDTVRREHKDWDFARICDEFTNRFTTFLNIVLPHFPFHTLFIGGGHANYLHRSDIRTETPVERVVALRGRTPDIDVDADLIPLLGVLQLSKD